MTKTLATTADTNDLFLDVSGNIVVLSGLPAVEQCCATASKLQLGEAVLETGLGIPNFESIWIGSPNYSLWQSFLITALNNVIGVNSVESVVTNTENGILSYTATIASEFGAAEIKGSLTT
jgi:hypothetical protein